MRPPFFLCDGLFCTGEALFLLQQQFKLLLVTVHGTDFLLLEISARDAIVNEHTISLLTQQRG